jgi:thiamine-phosphate pyrophosphorylase
VKLADVRVVVITDRRACDDLVARVAAIAVVPGVMFQVREKDLDGAELLALARRVVLAAAGAPVWLNDRADIARLAGADGVHLAEAGMSVADARALVPGLAVGCSRHAAESAVTAARDGADLVQLGPCFETPGKPPIGLAPLAVRIRAHLVAVGGITGPDQARAAIAAGANAVAVIRAAWRSPDPADAIAALVAATR